MEEMDKKFEIIGRKLLEYENK